MLGQRRTYLSLCKLLIVAVLTSNRCASVLEWSPSSVKWPNFVGIVAASHVRHIRCRIGGFGRGQFR
jgi:hypothetical protein